MPMMSLTIKALSLVAVGLLVAVDGVAVGVVVVYV